MAPAPAGHNPTGTAPTDAIDQEVLDELRTTARGVVARAVGKGAGATSVWEADPIDEDLWHEASSLGWSGLLVDPADGGGGGGLAAASVVVMEVGARVACVPFLSSAVLAVIAVGVGGTAAQRGLWLPGLAAGTRRGTVALSGESGRVGVVDVEATESGTGFTLRGTASYVIDGDTADLIIVAARLADDALVLFGIDSDQAQGLRREELLCVDRSRHLATLFFDDVAVHRDAILAGSDAEPVLAAVSQSGGVALAADAIGAAREALELSVAYAKNREQFGRPIGSFQAIKHKLADMYLDLQGGLLAVEGAARAIDERRPDAARLAAVAAAYARDAASKVTGDAIQVHGGIGYTWEHPCHRLFKRAKFDEVMLGDPALYREEIARLLLDGRDRT